MDYNQVRTAAQQRLQRKYAGKARIAVQVAHCSQAVGGRASRTRATGPPARPLAGTRAAWASLVVTEARLKVTIWLANRASGGVRRGPGRRRAGRDDIAALHAQSD